MRFLRRIRSLPLRGKVLLTVLGTAVAALGASTYLSFRYWQAESLATAERQALLAAGSARTTVESALRLGRPEAARHSVELLQADGAIEHLRVYTERNQVVFSSDPFEEGRRRPAVWIPSPRDLPSSGLVTVDADGARVHAFLPLSVPQPAVLEVVFSVAATKAAMDRGARLGIVLMAVSLLSVALIVVTMFEREVVAPLARVEGLLKETESGPGRPRRSPAIDEMERTVTRLLERERHAEALAEDRHRRLARAEGLAEVGELAAEMAHEFKRPLASIRTALAMLQQEYRLDEGGQEVLGAVNEQLEALHGTMQDLFSLAKPIVLEEEAVAVHDLLDEALLELTGLPCAAGVEVVRSYGEDAGHVSGDPRRLRQAFVNVMVNAAEAMEDGGTLTVSVEAPQPDAVDVLITDTGPGLTAEAAEAAVRPFYSTKPQGTGLGLPLVARIVAAHRGGLAIESSPGKGTTVRVTLPRAAVPAGTGR